MSHETLCTARFADYHGAYQYGMPGSGVPKSVPGFIRNHVTFRGNVTLEDHPLCTTLPSYLRDGVGVHDFLIDSHKGPFCDLPYNVDRFSGEVFANCTPPPFTGFVDTEVQSLIDHGCVV